MNSTAKILSCSIALAFVTLVFGWFYLMSPTFDEGDIRAAKIVLKLHPGAFFEELDSNFRPMALAISFFYFRESRMPTPGELKGSLTRESLGDSGLLWDKYGTNRLGKETYYYYGYEKGECTFFADPTSNPDSLNQHFQENILPIISRTFTELEHQWILKVNVSEPVPQYLALQPAVSSSVCLELLELMHSIHPDRYEEIRNELLQEIQEGSYDPQMCVFSKPFQERIAKRKKEQEASRNGAAVDSTADD
jgi:hypothetical protein